MKILFTTLLILLTADLHATGDWLTNIEEAQKKAKAERKLVLLLFTGSDWCPPCKALKKNVFDSNQFKAYAEKNLVLVELDFPRDKNKITKEQSAYNRSQAKKFEVKGYPTVILLAADGKKITRKVGYSAKISVESYIEALTTAITAGTPGSPSGRKPDDGQGRKPDDGQGGKPDDGQSGKPDGGQSGKPDGPPNKVDGKGGKKPNRGVLRKPGGNSGKKPQNGKKPDGEQGGERLNWKELLGLTDEQAKKFHAVMKKFREELEKINADKSLNPEKKMKARDSARKRRNAKLAQILTEEQMKKFRELWREEARPGNRPDSGEQGKKPDGEQAALNLGDWAEWLKKFLRLTDEQKEKVSTIIEEYREKLEEINDDEELSPGEKQKACNAARKKRNEELAGVLKGWQYNKLMALWREKARPGPDYIKGDEEDDDGSSVITRQQRAKMAKLMGWFSSQVKRILNSGLSNPEKNKRIAKLKNTYRQKRSEILSPEQAAAWSEKDGISVSSNRDIDGGNSTEDPDSGK